MIAQVPRMAKSTLATLIALIATFALLSVAAQAGPATGSKIKKCQDASGHWHYGDNADDMCRQSKIVEINEQGLTTKEIAAPMTAEQLKQGHVDMLWRSALNRHALKIVALVAGSHALQITR